MIRDGLLVGEGGEVVFLAFVVVMAGTPKLVSLCKGTAVVLDGRLSTVLGISCAYFGSSPLHG